MAAAVPPYKRRRSNYYSLGLVGQGQFGQVYCAIHRKNGQLVALKNLNRDRLTTHHFLRELRFLLSLEHPHIANCHALAYSPTGRQLVLDYCEGGTLRTVMEQDMPFSLAEVLTLVTQVLEALDHAHRQNIIHCDIKPENILLGLVPGGWQVKVSDFGIARLKQDPQGYRTGATGSPAYMAPERFYHQHSAASDLYAVGILLFELLVGERPFSGAPNQLMVAHLNQNPVIPATLPLGLQDILRKALQKLVGQRFQQAAAMQGAIADLRQTLTATELQELFPLGREQSPRAPYRPKGIISLPRPVYALGLTPGTAQHPALLLLGEGDRVVAIPISPGEPTAALTPTQEWLLPAPSQAFLWGGAQPVVSTGTTLYQLLPGQAVQGVGTFPERVQLSVSMDGQWWVAHSADQLWLVSVPQVGVQKPQAIPLPFFPGTSQGEIVQALMLDRRHLLVAIATATQTRLHILTRRGHALGALTLNVPLAQLTLTQTPFRLLAQEAGAGAALLILDIKPFRVMRCRLDGQPDWMGELAAGFVTLSQGGELRLVSRQGQIIGQVDGLPCPKAIAFDPPDQLWLVAAATAQEPPQLHPLNLRELDLDIIF